MKVLVSVWYIDEIENVILKTILRFKFYNKLMVIKLKYDGRR